MAKREVDKAKTAKALRRLRKVAARTAEPDAPKLTAWEQDFVAGVSTRLETYGSAFRDLSKGRAEEALSERQTVVARVIEKKTRPKKARLDDASGRSPDGSKARKDDPSTGGFRRSTFKPKPPPTSRARIRHVEDDLPDDTRPDQKAPDAPAPSKSVLPLKAVAAPPLRPQMRRQATRAAAKEAAAPRLRVIPGGKSD